MAPHSDPYKNKRTVRERMRGFAARHLGVGRTELLDPAVNLLLEALSEEVYGIAGTIEAAEDRIRDLLASLLAPCTDAVARPAHAVLHAEAIENATELTEQTEFRCAANGLTFYPAVNARLYRGGVRRFSHNERLYAVNPGPEHSLLTRSGKRDPAASGVFWIGLATDDSVEDLKDLSFYIDFNGVYNKEKYLNLLSCARWKLRDEELSLARGVYSVEEKPENDVLAFFSAFDVSGRINRETRELYAPRFLTIKNSTPVRERETFPRRLKAVFPERVQNGLTEPLSWIEVACPAEFSPEILDAIRISVNAFPVVNKKLVCKTAKTGGMPPVIPLSAENGESFLSAVSVSDSRGKRYCDVPVNDDENAGYGIYSLARGGHERYGRREAAEFLSERIDRIVGEASAFFENRSDVGADLKKMIGEDETPVGERREIENYILAEPEGDEETCFLSYWTTRSEEANGLPRGTFLQAPPEALLSPSSVFTLSEVRGGKRAPQPVERKRARKRALSRPALLITDEDIADFCLTRFRDSVRDVEVKKGFAEDPRVGFVRTTDVYLTLRGEVEKHVRDGASFLRELRERSPETHNYRVFVN